MLLSILSIYNPNEDSKNFIKGIKLDLETEWIVGIRKGDELKFGQEYEQFININRLYGNFTVKIVGDFDKKEDIFNLLISNSKAFFFIFKHDNEIWQDRFLKDLKGFFLERQEFKNAPKNINSIFIDVAKTTRHMFYFLGKGKLDEENESLPATILNPNLNEVFNIEKVLQKPEYFQPTIKWLYPKSFILEHLITLEKQSENFNFNLAIFTFNMIVSIYKTNNYFEPAYYSSYLDFDVPVDVSSKIDDILIYKEIVKVKQDIICHEKNSLSKEFKKYFS
jgi:hypothetical protein